MNKKAYLDLLRYYLRELPTAVLEDIISDYEEHFRLAAAEGKKEEEIAAELGSPETVAEEYLGAERFRARPFRHESQPQRTEEKVRRSGGKFWKYLLISLLVIIFFLPVVGVVFGILGTIVSVLGALLLAALAVLAVGLLLPLTIIPALVLPAFVSIPLPLMVLSPFTKIFLMIFLLSASVLMIAFFVKMFRWLLKALRDLYISICWQIRKWRKQA